MENNTFGERLKYERNRLGLSQEAFAAIGGVKKLAQISYEQGKTVPDINFIKAVSGIGVDAMYVIFGTPTPAMLSHDEHELLQQYRRLDVKNKTRLLGLVEGLLLGTNSNGAK